MRQGSVDHPDAPNRARPTDRAVMTVAGTCAPRSPWSRLRALAVRVAFVGGACLGGWFGSSAVATAIDLPEIDKPQIEVELPRIAVDRPEPVQVQPSAPDRPVAVEPVRAETPEPDGEPAEAEAVDGNAPSTPATPPTPAPVPPPHSAAPPRVAHTAPLPNKRVAVPRAATHEIPQPRAPDAAATPQIAPLNDAEPAPQPPTTTVTAAVQAGASGLRDVQATMPVAAELAAPPGTWTAWPKTRTSTDVLSPEPSASPD
ncbi:hypothetical protein GCM10011581_32330 [Saccharopolyspora subtropica]|uniref:Uncharacterized protein n=1 Tax=Saccharopolyspora thermophila TaxID=89367 RepID=A0A917JYR5_9PSEU|nr:hypothetical protein [Saccharopolyspora subtropica]GGI92693.1 hypothetical protein GCM10011581_32330 [Saccharopolyspora subtropica]